MNPPIYIADPSDFSGREEQANSLNNAQQAGQSNQETNPESNCCAGACQITWKPIKAVNS